MEQKIKYHIDKFISFLFGKENDNDSDQRIYNKLLRLEGEELEAWMNAKLKKYIICAGVYFEFQGDEFEGIDGPTLFETWYIINIDELMKYDEIYNHSDPEYTCELREIILKLHNFQQPIIRDYDRDLDWRLHIITDYMEIFIMIMTSEDLKSYIIQQIDPIEIR
jgi:hypothetical protein